MRDLVAKDLVTEQEPDMTNSGGDPGSPEGPPAAKNERILLAVILMVAAALRFFALGSNPPGFMTDEAGYGVGAASIAATGRTIHGDFLPLYYHEPTYARWGNSQIIYQPVQLYATVPFIWMFGKTEFATRAPSVCFALLAILGAYLFAREMFGGTVGLATAALLTLSPWHVHLSRIAYEVMSLSAVLTWQAYLLWKGRSSRGFLIAGAAMTALATYTYPPGRLFAPLLALGFLVLQWKSLKARRNDYLLAAAVGFVLMLPNIHAILTDTRQGRMYTLLIFTADTDGEPAIRFLRERAAGGGLWGLLYEMRPLRLLILFLSNWFQMFSPSRLFFEGPPLVQLGPREHGLCLLILAPLTLLGIADRLRAWKDEGSRFVLWWLISFPVPACLTVGSFLSSRSVTMFPILEILAALGLAELIRKARSSEPGGVPRTAGSALAGVAALFLMLAGAGQAAWMIRNYHVRYKDYANGYWDQGFTQALEITRRISPPDERIVMSDSIMNAYLFLLFYDSIDFRDVRPRGPEFEGLLPAKYLVCGPGHPPPPDEKTLWIIRGHERSFHSRGEIVGQVPFPDGAVNLLLVRHPAGGSPDRMR